MINWEKGISSTKQLLLWASPQTPTDWRLRCRAGISCTSAWCRSIMLIESSTSKSTRKLYDKFFNLSLRVRGRRRKRQFQATKNFVCFIPEFQENPFKSFHRFCFELRSLHNEPSLLASERACMNFPISASNSFIFDRISILLRRNEWCTRHSTRSSLLIESLHVPNRRLITIFDHR